MFITLLQLWLALASLCVLGQEHVERLSSGQWVGGSEPNTPRVGVSYLSFTTLTSFTLSYNMASHTLPLTM